MELGSKEMEDDDTTKKSHLYAKPVVGNSGDVTKDTVAGPKQGNQVRPLLPPGQYSLLRHEQYENIEMVAQS